MSTYTTTLNEVMKDINNRKPKPIVDMINTARPVIFDFDYVTPKNVDSKVFKEWFETTFLTKFALWEIGFDTYEQFHLQLWSKCNRIMPKYAVILERLFAIRDLDDSAYYNIKKGTVDNTYQNSDTTVTKNKNVHSTLPINMINTDDIGGIKYADDGTKSQNDNNRNAKGTDDTKYDLKMGVYIDSLAKLVSLFDTELLSATDKLFDEFNYLFLGVM